MLVCKLALCQGHGLSALNLPSCRSRIQGPNKLGGVLLGGRGGGIPFSILDLFPNTECSWEV